MLLALALAAAIPPTGTLVAADLNAILDEARVTVVDQFSNDPSDLYVGRAFIFQSQDPRLEIAYNKETSTLTVRLRTCCSLKREEVELGTAQGQNAYGARAAYKKVALYWYSLSATNIDPYVSADIISYSAKLDSEMARGLSSNLAVRITGVSKSL